MTVPNTTMKKGDRVGDGILTYIHPSTEPNKHVCAPPSDHEDIISRGSVWWCLVCDLEFVLEGKGWKKWRKRL